MSGESCGIENFKAIVQGDVFECSVAPDMPARIDRPISRAPGCRRTGPRIVWRLCGGRKAGRIGTFRAICESLGCAGDTSRINTAARMKDEAA